MLGDIGDVLAESDRERKNLSESRENLRDRNLADIVISAQREPWRYSRDIDIVLPQGGFRDSYRVCLVF